MRGPQDIPSTVVREKVHSVDDWVTQSLVRVVHAHLRTNAPSLALRGTSLHLSKVLQIILDTVISVAGCDSVETLLTHLSLFGIVGVGFPLLDQLDGEVVQLVEVVGGVSDGVSVDI